MRTIAEGILAMQPGDTLNIRGAHGSFDGVYFEQLSLDAAFNTGVTGKDLACTAGSPCVIQGCRAAQCGTDEVPIIRGMRLRSDWTNEGGGIYSRTMEAQPNGTDWCGTVAKNWRDDFDPGMLIESGAPMPYEHDSHAAPTDGKWSYHPYSPNINKIFVNPTGSGNPATTVYVPHFLWQVCLGSGTDHVTLQYLTFEGTRYDNLDVGNPGGAADGLALRHITIRHSPDHHLLAHTTPGIVVDDVLAEHGCRGRSWAKSTGDGCFAFRLFAATGGSITNSRAAHMGATGAVRLSSPTTCTCVTGADCDTGGGGVCANGICTVGNTMGGVSGATCGGSSPACENGVCVTTGEWGCSWCDAPWNDPATTFYSMTGMGFQVKQTVGFTFAGNTVLDVQNGGISVDVSRNVLVEDNDIRRAKVGISTSNFTPTSTCPTTDPSAFCYTSDNVIDGNRLEDTNCAVSITDGPCHGCTDIPPYRHQGAQLLARVTNNVGVRPRDRLLCLPDPMPADLLVSGNVEGTGDTTSTSTSTSSSSTTSTSSSSSTSPSTSSSSSTSSSTSSTSSTSTSVPTPTTSSTSTSSSSTSPSTSSSSSTSSSTSTTTPVPPGCGDGTTAPGEECDDGNLASLDGCDAFCNVEELAATASGLTISTSMTLPDDALAASIVSPSVGPLRIAETSPTFVFPPDVVPLNRQIHLEAPPASQNDPLELTVAIDDAMLPPAGTWDTIDVFRNGTRLAPCTGANRRAQPDPCIGDQMARTEGGVLLTVLSSDVGDWTFGTATKTPSTSTSTSSTSTTSTSRPPSTSTSTSTSTSVLSSTTFSTTTSVTTSSTSSTLSASTSTSTSTTTSTLFPRSPTTTLPVSERCLGASKLLLVDSPSKPTRRRLWVESEDVPQLVVGDGLDPAPLATKGGSLRVTAVGGDEFDVTYPLLAEGWKVIGQTGDPRGLRYRNPTGPVTSVVFKAGRMLRITGKGALLEHSLGTEPDVVRVALQVGPFWYRAEFGGNLQRFTAGKQLLRKRALRPLDCGQNGLASPGGAFGS